MIKAGGEEDWYRSADLAPFVACTQEPFEWSTTLVSVCRISVNPWYAAGKFMTIINGTAELMISLRDLTFEG